VTHQRRRQNRGPLYVLKIRPVRSDSKSNIHGLRAILKILLRRFGFRCIAAHEEQSPDQKMESSNV
jgi:hypothetical protein